MDGQAPRERQATHLVDMMQRLGIDPSGGAVPRLSLIYATAFHRCDACSCKQACRDWLDRMPQSVAFAPRFCPDADILFELQVDQPRPDRTRAPSEPETITGHHAYSADLERLEDEIDEVLISKATDDSLIADLKQRKSHLRNELDRLRQEAVGKGRPH